MTALGIANAETHARREVDVELVQVAWWRLIDELSRCDHEHVAMRRPQDVIDHAPVEQPVVVNAAGCANGRHFLGPRAPTTSAAPRLNPRPRHITRHEEPVLADVDPEYGLVRGLKG